MAKASTRDFEIYVKLATTTAEANQALDLTDYVDIAENQAFEVHEVDIVLDMTEDFPANDTDSKFQLADSNIQAFVSLHSTHCQSDMILHYSHKYHNNSQDTIHLDNSIHNLVLGYRTERYLNYYTNQSEYLIPNCSYHY